MGNPHNDDGKLPDFLAGSSVAGEAPDAETLDTMFRSLSDAIAQTPSNGHLSAMRTTVRYGVAAALSTVITAGTWAFALRKDYAAYPGWWMGLTLVAYLALLIWLIELALRPDYKPAPGQRTVTASASGAFGMTLLLATVAVSHADSATLATGLGADLHCMSAGAAVGTLLFILLRVLDRGKRGGRLLAAGAATLLGNIMLQLHCQADGVAHRIVGHAGVGLPLLVWVAALWVLDRKRTTGPAPDPHSAT